MTNIVSYCLLPYHLQTDEVRARTCYITVAIVYSVVISLLSIFIMSEKFSLNLSMILALPVFFISVVVLFGRSLRGRYLAMRKRDKRYDENIYELNMLFPKLTVSKKEAIALAQANRTK